MKVGNGQQRIISLLLIVFQHLKFIASLISLDLNMI